jgi:UDP-glucose:(heptosyl)LPS alpha-1,3-glucosyltransferase
VEPPPSPERACPDVTLVGDAVGTAGGTEDQVGRLARRLLADGHRVRVVARACGLAPDPALDVVRVPGPGRPAALAFAWFFAAGGAAVALRRRGLVHTTGACVPNRADVRTVHFCHAAYLAAGGAVRASRHDVLHRLNGWVAERIARAAERLCYRRSRSRVLVTVSPGAARDLRAQFPRMADAVRVVPNAVDPPVEPDPAVVAAVRRASGATDDERVALFVGGDWERKGVTSAVDALAGAEGWRLIVVGAGDGDALLARAREAGVGDRVHVAGVSPDPSRFYAAADAFVLPSSYETFSLATYEAARAGLPLVATPVCGVEDVLEDGRTGVAVAPDAGAVAAALGRLDDAALRERMGDAAREAAAAVLPDGDPLAAYGALYAELA